MKEEQEQKFYELKTSIEKRVDGFRQECQVGFDKLEIGTDIMEEKLDTQVGEINEQFTTREIDIQWSKKKQATMKQT